MQCPHRSRPSALRRLKSLALIVLLAVGGLGLVAGPAVADALDDARAAGWLGETQDGLVGVVDPSAPADVKALAEEINAKRMARYREIANENGAPVSAVQKLTAKKVIERLPAGTYVQDASGQWVKK